MLATVQKSDLLLRILLTSTNNPSPADQIVPPLRRALNEQQGDLKKYKGQTVPRSDSSER